MQRILEVCAANLASVEAAAAAGAQRVELCAALSTGGVTPSPGFIREARRHENLLLHVLIRPRDGDFVYSPAEVRTMEADIRMARDEGADAVVVGALTPEGRVDTDVCARLVEAARGMRLTFHRAFDVCAAPLEAVDRIAALGFDRLLTSGAAPTAAEGVGLIAELQALVRGRLAILPGSGVTSRNARALLEATGCGEIHSSARGAAGGSVSTVDEVAAILRAIDF